MDIPEYAALFKALSEPVRLRILHLLLDKGELCVCDIVDTLGVSQSVISRHLAYLRNTDLLDTRREGVWIYYQITKLSPFTTNVLALFLESSTDSNVMRDDLHTFQAIAKRSCS